MELFDEDYSNYFDAKLLFQADDIESWGLDESYFSRSSDSSSPDASSYSPRAKNIVCERNRRTKLKQKLFALRSVVPKITKMDKASIIKDAIEYIQELHEEERRIRAEIGILESGKQSNPDILDFDYLSPSLSRVKEKRSGQIMEKIPIEVLELRVSEVGERTSIISITCSKKTDTMVKLCEVFESLQLKIITANITAFAGRLLKTVFVEADEMEKALLQTKIEAAIASTEVQ